MSSKDTTEETVSDLRFVSSWPQFRCLVHRRKKKRERESREVLSRAIRAADVYTLQSLDTQHHGTRVSSVQRLVCIYFIEWTRRGPTVPYCGRSVGSGRVGSVDSSGGSIDNAPFCQSINQIKALFVVGRYVEKRNFEANKNGKTIPCEEAEEEE